MQNRYPASEYKRLARGSSEAQIQKAICRYLDLCGIVYSVTDSSLYFDDGKPRRKTKADGWPDVVCCVSGRFVGIETKSRTGRMRPAQIEMRRRIEDAGGVYLIARSVEDVEKGLQALGDFYKVQLESTWGA